MEKANFVEESIAWQQSLIWSSLPLAQATAHAQIHVANEHYNLRPLVRLPPPPLSPLFLPLSLVVDDTSMTNSSLNRSTPTVP